MGRTLVLRFFFFSKLQQRGQAALYDALCALVVLAVSASITASMTALTSMAPVRRL